MSRVRVVDGSVEHETNSRFHTTVLFVLFADFSFRLNDTLMHERHTHVLRIVLVLMQVGLIAARRTGRLRGGKATAALAEKAKEKK